MKLHLKQGLAIGIMAVTMMGARCGGETETKGTSGSAGDKTSHEKASGVDHNTTTPTAKPSGTSGQSGQSGQSSGGSQSGESGGGGGM